jgi:proline iminopeptidase
MSARRLTLFPEIEPYDSGHLRVSELHRIYYEQVGNPSGKPLFVLHGGPGAGCSPMMRRYADPERFRIVLHDQRGAGRSLPFGEIRENTTQALVEDVERLRQHLKIKRMILLGGSWGSTLALAYAEAYPDHVAGLVLRGIFLGTRQELDLYFPRSVGDYFPEIYERLCAQIPEMPGKSLPERVFALLESPDEEVRRNAARAWVEFELRTVVLQRTDEEVRQEMDTFDPEALARLETFYIVRDCFLEEGQLLRDIGRIQHIPAVILNGRYDLMTPPVIAWKLHKALPKSELWFIEAAGHSGGEPATQEGLVRALRRFE